MSFCSHACTCVFVCLHGARGRREEARAARAVSGHPVPPGTETPLAGVPQVPPPPSSFPCKGHHLVLYQSLEVITRYLTQRQGILGPEWGPREIRKGRIFSSESVMEEERRMIWMVCLGFLFRQRNPCVGGVWELLLFALWLFAVTLYLSLFDAGSKLPWYQVFLSASKYWYLLPCDVCPRSTSIGCCSQVTLYHSVYSLIHTHDGAYCECQESPAQVKHRRGKDVSPESAETARPTCFSSSSSLSSSSFRLCDFRSTRVHHGREQGGSIQSES